MQISTTNSSFLFFNQHRISQEQRETIRNAENTALNIQKMLANAKDDSSLRSDNSPVSAYDYDSVIIDSSINESFRIKMDFFWEMGTLLGFSRGIEAGMEAFERLHAEIINNYKGEERDRRIALLESTFETLAGNTARHLTFRIQTTMSSNDRNVITSRDEHENFNKLRAAMRRLENDITNMFSASLDFFRANGSFSGFMDTAAANRPGTLSLRDVDNLFSQLFDKSDELDERDKESVSAGNLDTSELSDYGRDFLLWIRQGGYLQRSYM